jgi:hypothetical protein
MLTPEQIEALRIQAGQLMDPVVEFLIGDIARRITEAGQLTSTAAYQVWRAQNLGLSQRQLKKELRKRLKVSHRELRKLMTQAAEVGYNFDVSRFPYVQAVPFGANEALQRIVSAAVDMAQEDLTNITQTMGFVTYDGVATELTEAYQKSCDYAFQKVVTGAQDYNSAIREATRGLVEKGILSLDYESGVHTSVEAAVRRNMMGGLGLMQERISQQNHDDLGCDGWEISAHAACAPDHEPIQGKQYPDAAYTRLNNSLKRRIGTLNCGHSAMPIILGINDPQYTPEELERFRQDNEKGFEYNGKHYTQYEATQRQRGLERSIRKQKRRILVGEKLGDKEQLAIDQTRYVVLRDEYARFSEAAGLRTQQERKYVPGFGPKQHQGAERAKRQMDEEVARKEAERVRREKDLLFIRNDATIKANSGLPKKLVNLPDEILQHTVNVDFVPTKPNLPSFHAVAPKGADMTEIEVMAGAGTCTPIRDLRRLYEVYGRSPDGWQKKSGTVYGKEYHYVIHWYEHNGFVPEAEIKLKGMKKNK